MSIAAVHYTKFAQQVSRDRVVYSFSEDGQFLVFKGDGRDVVPVWSSVTRLQRIQKELPSYQKYDATGMPLDDFLAWLPQLEQQAMRLGVNWAGRNLIGYDVEPGEVRALLDAHMVKR